MNALSAAAVCLLLALSGNAQIITSAPVSRQTNAPALAPTQFNNAPAPGPGSTSPRVFNTAGCPSIMDYLSFYSNIYSDLIELIEAAPASANLTETLSTGMTALTLLAPTNTGANASLTAVGSRPAAVARSPDLTLRILEYHILPTPIPPRDLKTGYSFNTLLLNSNGQGDSLAVSVASSGTITLTGDRNSATLGNSGIQVCQSVVYSLNGLLLPADLSAD